MAAHNARTVVVIHSVGPVLMPWIDHPNISAVVMAGLPGEISSFIRPKIFYFTKNQYIFSGIRPIDRRFRNLKSIFGGKMRSVQLINRFVQAKSLEIH